jgi:hypothetical protein
MKASVRVKCAYSSLHLLHPPLLLPPLLNPLLQKAETANEETEESYFASAQLQSQKYDTEDLKHNYRTEDKQ